MSKYKVGDEVRYNLSLDGEVISINDGMYTLEYEDGSRHMVTEEQLDSLVVKECGKEWVNSLKEIITKLNENPYQQGVSAEDIEGLKVSKVFKKGSDVQLTKNFHLSEIDCKCDRDDCTTTVVDLEHIKTLQRLRDKVGVLKITSGYRCESHNKAVGGSKKSTHKDGLATDIIPLEESLARTTALADSMFNGLGSYPGKGFIHVDSRPKKSRWEG